MMRGGSGDETTRRWRNGRAQQRRAAAWRAEARGERGRAPRRAVSSDTEGARVDLAWGAARARLVDDAGGERRHGGKQRREMEVRADW